MKVFYTVSPAADRVQRTEDACGKDEQYLIFTGVDIFRGAFHFTEIHLTQHY